MSDKTRLLRLRVKFKRKRPKFIRQESWRYKRVKSSWRRPKGIDNKARQKRKGNIASPNIGYRAPKRVRHLHSSGFEEVVIHNITELERANPRTHVIKIAHGVGRRKRIMLQDRADELNILILNRTRILLPGEEMLLEGRGAERGPETIEELESFGEEEEEIEDELAEELESEEDNELLED